MKKIFLSLLVVILGVLSLGFVGNVEAKSYIKSYSRSSGVKVRSYTRYKADGYKFNNYSHRPDRGYKR